MRITCFFIIAYLSTHVINAQSYYYNITKTIKGVGYTYQCEVLKGANFVTLYNKENKFTHIDQMDRNIQKIITIEENRERQFEEESWAKPKCLSIINNAFSTVEKLRVKGKEITLLIYINPDSGKIDEVEYQFLSSGPYGTIPVSVYRQIEVELKKNIWFTPTKEGKRRNYILLGWRHEVK